MAKTPQQQMTKRYTESIEAYRAYLKGRHHWNIRTKEGFDQAINYFNQAIQLDPNYALAYAGLADTYSLQSIYVPGVSRGEIHLVPNRPS